MWSRTFQMLLAVAVTACSSPARQADEVISIQEQRIRQVVTLCGAGMRDTVTGKLVATLERTAGKIGVEFEREFKAAIPLTGSEAIEFYRQFLQCVARERSNRPATETRIYPSKELLQNISISNTQVRSERKANLLDPDDFVYRYESLVENRNEISIYCRYEIQGHSDFALPSCQASTHLWTERKDIAIDAGKIVVVTGSKFVAAPSRCWGSAKWFAKVLACWSQ